MNSQHEDLRDLPFAALFTRLADQIGRLVRNELALFKSELTASLKRIATAAGLFAAAGAIGLFVLIALTIAIINALTLVVPAWAAALITAGIYALIMIVCVFAGIASLKKVAGPKETVRSIEEDIRWAKTRAKSARR